MNKANKPNNSNNNRHPMNFHPNPSSSQEPISNCATIYPFGHLRFLMPSTSSSLAITQSLDPYTILFIQLILEPPSPPSPPLRLSQNEAFQKRKITNHIFSLFCILSSSFKSLSSFAIAILLPTKSEITHPTP